MVSDAGPERVRRGHLGTVLRLSGLQYAQRLDAHLVRRRCHRRICRRPSSRNPTGCTTGMEAGSGNLRVSQVIIPFKRAPAGLAHSRCITVITDPSFAPKMASGSPSSCCRTRCGRCSNPTCARKPPTTQSFRKTQDMRTDTSNNTVYADANGTIAYFHGNFIPKRDTSFDFTHPVDGSNPATEWQGPHASRTPLPCCNPSNGWLFNSNNWPFSAAGDQSPKRENYPRYMWTRGENPRGPHAIEVLSRYPQRDLGQPDRRRLRRPPDRLRRAAAAAVRRTMTPWPADDPRRAELKEAIETLRAWNRRTAADSVATAVAIFWGQGLIERNGAGGARCRRTCLRLSGRPI